MSIISPEIIDSIVKELEIDDIGSASIRQLGAIVRAAEARTIGDKDFEFLLALLLVFVKHALV